MRSKINQAEAVKREAVLGGQGEAAAITQEAKSLTEALDNISSALQVGELGDSSEALNLRLSEQYLETLTAILHRSSVLMVPTNTSGSQDMFSPQNIA